MKRLSTQTNLSVLLALAALLTLILNQSWLRYALSLLVYAALCLLFGRTLLPGRTPLISRLAKRFHGRLSTQSVAYTRAVTIAWTLLFAAMLLETLVLATLALPPTWSLLVTLINIGLIITLFLAEFRLRRWFVTDVDHPPLLELIRFLKRTGLRPVDTD